MTKKKNNVILITLISVFLFIALISVIGGIIYFLQQSPLGSPVESFVQRVSSDCSFSGSSSSSVPSGTTRTVRADSNQQLQFNLVWDASGESIGIRGVIQQGQSHTFGSTVPGVWEDFHINVNVYTCGDDPVDEDICAAVGQSCGFSTTAPGCCTGLDCQFFQCLDVGTCNSGDTACGEIGDPNKNGEILYECIGSTWKSQGRVSGECGYEVKQCTTVGQSCGFSTTAPGCCTGLDCQLFQCLDVGTCNSGTSTCGIIGNPDINGEILYECIGSTWKSQGRVPGKCGYDVKECAIEGQSCGFSSTAPECCTGFDCQFFGCVSVGTCNSGATTCGIIGDPDKSGEILYECIDSTWKSQGRVNGECGYKKIEDDLINQLNQKQRPISGGLEIRTLVDEDAEEGVAQCTLGGVIELQDKDYIVTAEHCIGKNIIFTSSEIGNVVFQGGERIGEAVYVNSDEAVDIALVSIDDNIARSTKTFLGHKIEGFGEPKEGMEVFKIGRTTGLTEGIITDTSLRLEHSGTGIKFRVFEIDGENFVSSGDSGSLIITKDAPHRIIGVLTFEGIDNGLGYGQHISNLFNEELREFLG